ncbi:hypothetical protein D1AOALGA4SA_10618 [Olavius algarvensis Delta 1 endosymbiont]|nr:hypothetical protein D1AOALGA4SA_10618 [Olavius algarvensis Delta 1 endosymbiont]
MSCLEQIGSEVQGSRFWVQRFKVLGSEVQGSRFWVQGSGFRVQGSVFRVQRFEPSSSPSASAPHAGFRIQGSLL